MALPDERMQARLRVAQGRPPAPADPRNTPRFKALYRQRGAVERCFGHLKTEWGFLPLRVRRLARVRLHTDLTMLARLGSALLAARARELPLVA